MEHVMRGRAIVNGGCAGPALVSSEPFSFWGGYDPQTGTIIDRQHPSQGTKAAGCVFAVPGTRGSSTTTAVLLEAIRAGTAPAAILTMGVDSFLALAAIIAQELYGKSIPIVALSPENFAELRTGDWIRLEESGFVTRIPAGLSDRAGL
jgi:predicted aconitase with swiveling domain